MRAALSTIQQTLTSDATTVLNHSIAEASRRNHGQTTPLHVAATLLASPSGFLRQACIRSHPNSSHPLQCRALELCFSVALDRLPTAQNASAPGTEPPISNALLAALKRAQANQRRGCPEQQQQPLLAVKVELQQLIISILDDPSVSRVMREASFSSPAVKVSIEQSLNSSTTHGHHQLPIAAAADAGGGNPNLGSNFGGIGGRILPNSTLPLQNPSLVANRNMYLNPRMQQGGTVQIGNHQKGEEPKKLLEIMVRTKKRNPILVGDSEPETAVKEFLLKIENKELGSEGILKNVAILSMEKGILSNQNQISTKMKELGGLIESRLTNGGVILDLGDLKWLVEQPTNSGGVQQQKPQAISEMGKTVVVEMAKLVARFNASACNDPGKKLWLIGTATCETYLRCEVYHSAMENDWDLQAVPISSRSSLPGTFPRLGPERLLNNPTLNWLRAVPSSLPSLTRSLDSAEKTTLCPKCSENYEKELAKLAAIEKSFSDAKQESSRPSLPQWLQSAKLDNMDGKTMDGGKDQAQLSKHKTQELQKKWRDTCLHLHPNFHQNTHPDRTVPPPALSMPNLYNSNLLFRPPFQPMLQAATKPLGEALKLNMNPVLASQPAERVETPPGSPVGTDLVLGRKETGHQAKDFLSCISSEPQTKLFEKFSDTDAYKKLLKGLMEKTWWQAEAASAVASAITRCKLGNGKRRGTGLRGDVWLLFTGPDRVGKKKMASVLAEQICKSSPIMICLGKRRDDEEAVDMNFRGKTTIDRIAEAVRRNLFSVIMLEDIDEADLLSQGSVKRAIERGRLTDSHGREVGLGNAIFIITGDWSTVNPNALIDGHSVDEKKLARGSFQLGLIVREKSAKRKGNWLQEPHGLSKPRKETGIGLSLDLNLAAAYAEDNKMDGSNNSSDLTIEDELGLINRNFSIASVPHELVSNVDDSIVFKPVDAMFVRREIKKTISVKFSMSVEENLAIEVEDDVLDKILGGLWHDRIGLGEWIDKALGPSFDQLKTGLLVGGGDRANLVARLVVESECGHRGKNEISVDWLPCSVLV